MAWFGNFDKGHFNWLTYNNSSQWPEVSAIKIVSNIAQQTSLFSIFLLPSKVFENWDGKYPKSNLYQRMECGEMSNNGEL